MEEGESSLLGTPTSLDNEAEKRNDSELLLKDLSLKIKLQSLNPHIVCFLCAGYLVNATTIVECLHTFCKSCIVRYIQIYKKCPTCNNSLPETEPHSALMLDRTMQDIMKKILPHIEEDEIQREKLFLANLSNQKQITEKPKIEDESPPLFNFKDFPVNYRTDEQINLLLQLDRSSGEPEIDGMKVVELANNYVRCSSRLQIVHLKKMIKRLYEPHSSNYQVAVFCEENIMNDRDSLKMNYVINWKRKEQPMIIRYRFESIVT